MLDESGGLEVHMAYSPDALDRHKEFSGVKNYDMYQIFVIFRCNTFFLKSLCRIKRAGVEPWLDGTPGLSEFPTAVLMCSENTCGNTHSRGRQNDSVNI